ncbi:MAG: 50S ribosomal protein L28 [Actinobacteria bacterium]|jgi:large subunit ribosomal protein L28|nr:50S ribosomal protein L28 [Actinomycetota bacterium]
MKSVCDICGKSPWFGKQVSHSHRRSSRRWDPNVQRLRIWKDGRVQKANVCTSCLKAGKVQRPPVKSR